MTPKGIGLIVGALSVVSLLVVASPNVSANPGGPGSSGAVFILTNSVHGNQVVAYARSASGQLSWVGNFSTGGTGSGASLADQGALVVTNDHQFLLAVDAGSNQLSVLSVGQSGGEPRLTLTDVVSSYGVTPVSVATFYGLVYVLNVGNATVPGNIAGFFLTPWGTLVPVPGSSQALSASGATGAAEIAFDPSAWSLIVTEKATSLIDVFPLNALGIAQAVQTHPSQSSTPYGFAVAPNGAIIVSEAATGTLSSYRAYPEGGWSVRSSSVPDYQTAPCWVVVAVGGTVAYTTNADSDSISSYAVHRSGSISLDTEVAATPGATPTDLAVTANGGLLYVRDAGNGQIQGYAISPSGALTWVSTVSGLPAGAEGLAAV